MDAQESHQLAEKVLQAGQTAVLADKPKPVIPMEQEFTAKHNCRHCHGRGYIGKDVKTDKKIPCRCLRPANKSTAVQGAPVSAKSGW